MSILQKVILFFLSYCPLQILTLKTCNKDISKIIIASSFKRGQLIDYLVIIKKKVVVFSYCPLQTWALKTCNKDISKHIKLSASNLVS